MNISGILYSVNTETLTPAQYTFRIVLSQVIASVSVIAFGNSQKSKSFAS